MNIRFLLTLVFLNYNQYNSSVTRLSKSSMLKRKATFCKFVCSESSTVLTGSVRAL